MSLGISNRYTSANLSFTESSRKFFCILDKTRIAISHCCETHLSAASTIVIRGFRELLDKIVVATASLLDCKVLIALQDATLQILPTDLFELVGKFDIAKWLHQNKAALISSPDIDQYKQLITLGEGRVNMRVEVGLFYDDRDAIKWLSGMRAL